jgi:gliding motility-associated lipoprotein GldD
MQIAHKSRTAKRLAVLSAPIIFFLLALSGCEPDYVPKEKGYHRIELPPQGYQPLLLEVPYTFLYSKNAVAKPDSDRFSEPNWINLHYPSFDADVEFTYKALPGKNDPNLNQYIETARKLTNKHQVKASSIDERRVMTNTGDAAMVFRLKGQVPTQYQFYVTDSAHHFLRAALYFKTAIQNDSLAPIIDYIARDMDTLLHTLEWRKK